MNGKTIWLTGLPCSGKTTIATKCKDLFKEFESAVLLDGDVVRDRINNKSMTQADRKTHLSYIGLFSSMLNDLNHNVICSFITPTNVLRQIVFDIVGRKNVFLVYSKPNNFLKKVN